MKKFLLVLAMLAIGSVAVAEELEFTVPVPTSGVGITIVPGGNHLAISTDTAGITMRVYGKRYSTTGTFLAWYGQPSAGSGTGTQYPAAGDSVFTIYDQSILPLNIFNDVKCDSLYFWNSSGSSVNVLVKVKR